MSVEQRPGRNLVKGSLAVLVAVLALAVLAAGCGGGGERDAQGQPSRDEAPNRSPAEERTTGGTTARESEDTEGSTVEEGAVGESEGPGDEARAGEVRLRIEGDPETTFSGTCAVGGEEQDVSGAVPGSFAYELGDGKLECEIGNQGPGGLEVVLESGNDRSVHRTNAPGAVVKLTYSKDGVSSSTSSSSSGGSVVQQSSSSSGGSVSQRSSVSSGSVVQQSSSSSGDSR